MNEEQSQKFFWENFEGNVRFYIPAKMLKDRTIKPLDREVYMIIDFLNYSCKYCFATNTTLMKMLNIGSSATIQASINKLVEKGYLIKVVKYENGSNRRRLYTLEKIEQTKSEEQFKRDYEEAQKKLEYDWINEE